MHLRRRSSRLEFERGIVVETMPTNERGWLLANELLHGHLKDQGYLATAVLLLDFERDIPRSLIAEARFQSIHQGVGCFSVELGVARDTWIRNCVGAQRALDTSAFV